MSQESQSPAGQTQPNADGGVDVVVVGAGPVGLALAIQLGQMGRSVLVLEQRPAPYPLPRAVHFDHEVGRILQSCGIGDELREISQPADIYEWQNAAGTTLLRFGREGMAMSGWPTSSMFSQPDLERLLVERCDQLEGVTIERGRRAVAIDTAADRAADGVSVRHVAMATDADGRQVEAGDDTTVHAAYVVGCDGANSTVRDLMGVTVADRGFFYDWLIVDLRLHEERVFDPINLQVCDPARPTTVVSGGPGRRRWEFMRLPHESIDDLNQEATAWTLLVDWDVRPDNATLERHAVYTFQARVVDQWQHGRVLLAGDAAHQMPPFAGQGLCAGLRDIMNLAWKLDHALGASRLAETGDDDPLLVTYHEERQPGAAAAIDFSIELGQVICVPDPAEAAARDAQMAARFDGTASETPPPPPLTSGCISGTGTAAGELFPQPILDDGHFDDVHGVGWRLITIEDPERNGALDPELGEWFAGIGGRIVAIDPSPELANWFASRSATHVLQRPDFHLFGAAADPAGAAHLVAELRDRLDPTG